MKKGYVKILGEAHPLCFSLSAVEEICERFGSVDAMSDALTNGSQLETLKAASDVLDILIRAGRRYAKQVGEPLPPEIKCSVADVIDATDSNAISAIFSVMSDDTEREVEVKGKNA